MRLFCLDPSVRRSADGRTLLGGSPFCVLRLSEEQARHLDAVLDRAWPATVDDTRLPTGDPLVDELLLAGQLQPVDPDSSPSGDLLGEIDVVIPSRNRPEAVRALLGQLPITRFASVTVVDDGSTPPLEPMSDQGSSVDVVRMARSRGPAAARRAGAVRGRARFLLFVDDDMTVDAGGSEPSSIQRLVGAAERWGYAAVAPRIVSEPGTSMAARYERRRGAIDRGDVAALVAAGTRVPFVATGLLLVRRAAYDAVGGFDEAKRRGEDVDLVWRLVEGGWLVRYEPDAVAAHPVTSPLRAWLRQRFDYGRGTAELAVEHPAAVSALSISPWSALVWGAALTGPAGLLVGAGALVFSIARLRAELVELVDDPTRDAIDLAGRGTVLAGGGLASAARRAWWPGVVLAACAMPWRWRRRVLGGLVLPIVADWQRTRPDLGPVAWTALALADELSYGAGLWRGAVATRSLRSLRIHWQSLDDLIVDGLPRRR